MRNKITLFLILVLSIVLIYYIIIICPSVSTVKIDDPPIIIYAYNGAEFVNMEELGSFGTATISSKPNEWTLIRDEDKK